MQNSNILTFPSTGYVAVCDPGVNGAVAVFRNDTLIEVVKAEDYLKSGQFIVTSAYIEQVGSMKWDTPKTAFVLGQSYGSLETRLRQVSMEAVVKITPREWQNALGVPIGLEYAERKKWVQDYVNQKLATPRKQPLWATDAIGIGLALIILRKSSPTNHPVEPGSR